MNTIELWHWRVTDPVSRCRYVTRYRMTQANALDFDPGAQRVEGSLERRAVRDDLQSITAPAGTGTMARESDGSVTPARGGLGGGGAEF